MKMRVCPKWGKLPACPNDARCSRFSVISVVVTLKREQHTQPHSRNQEGCATLSQHRAELAKGAHFLVRGDACHDVAGEAAGDVSFGGWQIEFPNYQSDDRSKGIAVVKTKRRQAMAAPAKINRFIERHRQLMLFFPQLTGRIVAVGGRFVQRVLGRAKHGVLGCNDLPGEGREPRGCSAHESVFPRRFPRCFDFLQLGHARALEKAFSSLRIDRLGGETILDGQSFGHQFLEQRIVQQLGVNLRLHAGQFTPFSPPTQTFPA